jgi:hypothetical protein
LWWVFSVDRKFIKKMSELPMNDATKTQHPKTEIL